MTPYTKKSFADALDEIRSERGWSEGNRDQRQLAAMAEEIERLRQEVAALKAWRDSATGCEPPADSDLIFTIPDGVYSMDAGRGIFEYKPLPAEDCGEWTKDENGEQIQVSPPRSVFHGCTVTFPDGGNSLFERNPDGSVKRVDGKPVPRQPDDPSEGDRLMAFFKGE